MKFTETATRIVLGLAAGLHRSWINYGFRYSMYASVPLGSRLPPDGRPPVYINEDFEIALRFFDKELELLPHPPWLFSRALLLQLVGPKKFSMKK